MKRGENSSLEELNYAVKKIDEWYRRNVKTISIFTAPFNTNLIFIDLIINVLREKNNVLYISEKNCEDDHLVEKLREKNKYFTYSHISEGEGKTGVTFVNYKDLDKIRGIYKLVIFDDINSFSSLNQDSLRRGYEQAIKLGERVVIYTIEPITQLGDRLEISLIGKEKPYVEPRIITTRIDLNKDIPYMLYDYLKWFRDNKSRVIIYVPSEDKLDIVYDYYENKLKMDGVKVVKLSRAEKKKDLKKVLKIKDKSIFIITDCMEDNLESSNVENAVILFADDIRYNYKKIIYLCGEIGRVNKHLPEVIFVSRDISENMDKVKDFTRVFNQKVWEKKLRIF